MNNFDPNNPYSNNPVLEDRKLIGARKVIASHLLKSYQTKVHTAIHRYLDVKELLAFVKRVAKGSIVDHFLRAVALSLKDMPELNATYDGTVHKLYEDVNLCYAISTKRGLVTPVIRNASTLSFEEFYSKRKEVISLVMEWKQELKDILGGTFTITNLGNFGVDWLHPIINPPQLGILGMGRLCKKIMTWDMEKEPEVKELMPISITVDHSVIDGSVAAEFAQLIQDKLDDPESLWDNI